MDRDIFIVQAEGNESVRFIVCVADDKDTALRLTKEWIISRSNAPDDIHKQIREMAAYDFWIIKRPVNRIAELGSDDNEFAWDIAVWDLFPDYYQEKEN